MTSTGASARGASSHGRAIQRLLQVRLAVRGGQRPAARAAGPRRRCESSSGHEKATAAPTGRVAARRPRRHAAPQPRAPVARPRRGRGRRPPPSHRVRCERCECGHRRLTCPRTTRSAEASRCPLDHALLCGVLGNNGLHTALQLAKAMGMAFFVLLRHHCNPDPVPMLVRRHHPDCDGPMALDDEPAVCGGMWHAVYGVGRAVCRRCSVWHRIRCAASFIISVQYRPPCRIKAHLQDTPR